MFRFFFCGRYWNFKKQNAMWIFHGQAQLSIQQVWVDCLYDFAKGLHFPLINCWRYFKLFHKIRPYLFFSGNLQFLDYFSRRKGVNWYVLLVVECLPLKKLHMIEDFRKRFLIQVRVGAFWNFLVHVYQLNLSSLIVYWDFVAGENECLFFSWIFIKKKVCFNFFNLTINSKP